MMASETYEVFALRYATRQAKRGDHFLRGGSVNDPEAPMPMDYFVWVIRGASRTILVDTGFTQAVGIRRNRTFLRPPLDTLRLLGSDIPDIHDVVLTHLHYDHAGGLAAFPEARVHLQEDELRWATSSELFETQENSAFEADDVVNVVRGLYGGRVQLHDGDWQLAPGVSVHHLGGHTPGLQALRVDTARGHLVLASDAAHFYENVVTDRPFSITHDAGRARAAFKRLNALADSPQLIIPGHDPLVLQRFPPPAPGLEGVAVRLDAGPPA